MVSASRPWNYPSSDFSAEPQPNGDRINVGAYGGTAEAATTLVDSDFDGIPDEIENDIFCLDPNDADTDDDGILDGNEDVDWDGIVGPNESDPCLADTDRDGIFDGTEIGLTTPQNLVATDLAAGFFVADANPSTTTYPNNADSDGDLIPDGVEDINHNGQVDPWEPDPNDATIDVLPDLDDVGDVDGEDVYAFTILFDPLTDQAQLMTFAALFGYSAFPVDSDGDGILDDGDYSGTTGDHPCTGGIVDYCDDN